MDADIVSQYLKPLKTDAINKNYRLIRYPAMKLVAASHRAKQDDLFRKHKQQKFKHAAICLTVLSGPFCELQVGVSHVIAHGHKSSV